MAHKSHASVDRQWIKRDALVYREMCGTCCQQSARWLCVCVLVSSVPKNPGMRRASEDPLGGASISFKEIMWYSWFSNAAVEECSPWIEEHIPNNKETTCYLYTAELRFKPRATVLTTEKPLHIIL